MCAFSRNFQRRQKDRSDLTERFRDKRMNGRGALAWFLFHFKLNGKWFLFHFKLKAKLYVRFLKLKNDSLYPRF